MKTNKRQIDCQEATSLMFDYIDGVAPTSDTEALKAHVSECDACQKELEERKAMLSTLKLAGDNPPPTLACEVMKKIENIPQEKKNRRFLPSARILSLASVAACVVIMLAVGFRSGLFRNVLVSDFKADSPQSARSGSESFSLADASDAVAECVGEKSENVGANGAMPTVQPQSGYLQDDADCLQETESGAPLYSATAPEWWLVEDEYAGKAIHLGGGKDDDRIDKVYSYLTDSLEDRAVIVGYYSRFEDLVKGQMSVKTVYGEITCYQYTINEKWLSLVEGIAGDETDNSSWKAYIPAEQIESDTLIILLPD